MKRPKVINILLSMLLKILKPLSGFLVPSIQIQFCPVSFPFAMKQPVDQLHPFRQFFVCFIKIHEQRHGEVKKSLMEGGCGLCR